MAQICRRVIMCETERERVSVSVCLSWWKGCPWDCCKWNWWTLGNCKLGLPSRSGAGVLSFYWILICQFLLLFCFMILWFVKAEFSHFKSVFSTGPTLHSQATIFFSSGILAWKGNIWADLCLSQAMLNMCELRERQLTTSHRTIIHPVRKPRDIDKGMCSCHWQHCLPNSLLWVSGEYFLLFN